MNADDIRQTIADHPDPETGRPIGKTRQLGDVTVDGKDVTVSLALTSHSRPIADDVVDAVTARIQAAHPGTDVQVAITEHDRPPTRSGTSALTVKSVIAVGSGKGGVGKSTVATTLALALKSLGSRVGIMDADVYGPSVPHLLGLTGRPAIDQDKRIQPIYADGIPVMSMGFLLDPDQAVIWRGPMLHGSINQFLGETDWGKLDYLIIDLPPGTGDVSLTLSQAVSISGAVVVCTPQEVALLDAMKAVSMFRKVNIPIAGMVENMSGFQCPDCGKTYDIFGRGGARERAEDMEVPFLGTLPIDPEVRTAGDDGLLVNLFADGRPAAAPMVAMARSLVRGLAARAAADPPKPSLPTL